MKPIEIQGHGSVAFLPDAKHAVAGGGGQSKIVGQWQVDGGQEVREQMEVVTVNCLLDIAVSQDGRFIACGGSYGLADKLGTSLRQKKGPA